MFNKKITTLWIVAALIGFIDAAYLTVSHYQGNVTCSVIQGCDVVLASSYSTIGSIPIALLGALYYLAMLLGMILVLDKKNEKIYRLLGWFSIVGFVMSSWLMYVQWQIVEAFCQYCLLSALTSTMLFILGMMIVKKKNTNIQ